MRTGKVAVGLTAVVSMAVVAGCGGEDSQASADTVTLYTCVSDETIQSIIDEFEAANAGSEVELFRAPTGELNARVAADVRSGGLRADVIWTCDPLTMQDYADQDLVGGFIPENASRIPAEYRTDDYVAAAVLYMVAVHAEDLPAPETWQDLTSETYADGVALPDPAFAASALGALGYFSQNPDYGLDFYRALQENGAVQVSTPTDVTTGVAEGVYKAGITIEKSAYVAKEEGSPIGVATPDPGAIAIYSPIAVARDAAGSQAAQDFVSFVTSEQGQQLIADSGASPASPAIESPILPEGTATVAPDWTLLAGQVDELLGEYQAIFGG